LEHAHRGADLAGLGAAAAPQRDLQWGRGRRRGAVATTPETPPRRPGRRARRSRGCRKGIPAACWCIRSTRLGHGQYPRVAPSCRVGDCNSDASQGTEFWSFPEFEARVRQRSAGRTRRPEMTRGEGRPGDAGSHSTGWRSRPARNGRRRPFSSRRRRNRSRRGEPPPRLAHEDGPPVIRLRDQIMHQHNCCAARARFGQRLLSRMGEGQGRRPPLRSASAVNFISLILAFSHRGEGTPSGTSSRSQTTTGYLTDIP
jgi:hypothetical protein